MFQCSRSSQVTLETVVVLYVKPIVIKVVYISIVHILLERHYGIIFHLILLISFRLKRDLKDFILLILPLSILIDQIEGVVLEGICSWSKSAEKGTSEIEPARRLPTIGLSHTRFDPFSRFNIDSYGRNRTKPR